ncbi:MAG: response regulator transcription factor [Treponema sp.]|nr:response regulator transcription factor [Treponema sp.]
MISIAIVCKRSEDREKIIAILGRQDDFVIVCTAEDGYTLLQSALPQQPDVIILDFDLGDVVSLTLTSIIRRRSPSTALIMLCSQEDRVSVEESLNAGISGYLVRQQGFANLAASVRSVYYGGLYIDRNERDETFNRICASAADRKIPDRTLPDFTPTELGIFSGITHGHTDTEIASSLNITIGTLRNNVNQAKKKTGLKNRTQVSIYALQAGMIRLERQTAGLPSQTQHEKHSTI